MFALTAVVKDWISSMQITITRHGDARFRTPGESPEQGGRCLQCFKNRGYLIQHYMLTKNGFSVLLPFFFFTLESLEQINCKEDMQ